MTRIPKRTFASSSFPSKAVLKASRVGLNWMVSSETWTMMPAKAGTLIWPTKGEGHHGNCIGSNGPAATAAGIQVQHGLGDQACTAEATQQHGAGIAGCQRQHGGGRHIHLQRYFGITTLHQLAVLVIEEPRSADKYQRASN